jgi:hypothetical protein
MRIVSRLLNDGQLVGYRIEHNNTRTDVTRLEAWYMAKNKQIDNIIAVGNEQNPSLSGINGFEIKTLPQIRRDTKSQKKAVKVTPKDMNAYAIRNNMQSQSSNEIKASFITYIDRLRKENFDFSKFHSMLAYFTVTDLLLDRNESLLGYRISYTGNEPFKITRIESNAEHKRTEIELQPNDNICLSIVETAVLSSSMELGCKFFNGCMLDTEYGTQKDTYEFLRNLRFCTYDCKDDIDKCQKLYGVPITKFVNDSEIKKYFIKSPENSTKVVNKMHINGILGVFQK